MPWEADICGWDQQISFALWLLVEFSHRRHCQNIVCGEEREFRVCLNWSAQCPQTEQTTGLTQGFGEARRWGMGGLSEAPVGWFHLQSIVTQQDCYWLVDSQRPESQLIKLLECVCPCLANFQNEGLTVVGLQKHVHWREFLIIWIGLKLVLMVTYFCGYNNQSFSKIVGTFEFSPLPWCALLFSSLW